MNKPEWKTQHYILLLQKKIKILITNSVPLNGGDEALLRATELSLKKVFPDAEITALCSNAALCRKYITDILLDTDLEWVRTDKKNSREWMFFKIRRMLLLFLGIGWNSRFSLMWANKDEARVKAIYRNCDLVISSAGGFLHDHYPIDKRMEGFKLAMSYKKPLILFAQSVGPFWKKDSIAAVQKEFPKMSAIILREKKSLKYLADVQLSDHNIYVTTDAAFLWRKLHPELFVPKFGQVTTIAMCFRNWPVENDRIEETILKAVELCKFLLQNESRRIIFLSTCQGIEGYIDDSCHAEIIVSKLPFAMQSRCEIDTQKYTTVDLISAYGKCDAFIGMRLHSAILSMLGGTAAMGIGYEDKTPGIFSMLGLQDYQISFDENHESWISCANHFLKNIDHIRRQLPNVLDEASNIAVESLAITKRVIEKR